MRRGYGPGVFGVLVSLLGCLSPEVGEGKRELPVETLTLGKLYDYPPKIVATLKGWTGPCEQLEVRERLSAKTFTLEVVSFFVGPEGTPCPAVALEFHETVILDGMSEPGGYTVIAGNKRASFIYPGAYEPEMVEVPVKSVDIALQESFPVQVVAHIVFLSGCDPAVYKQVTQRREGDTFFVNVRQATIPPELVTCPPVEILLTESVTLETESLEPGPYAVNVNGVVESFTLP